MKKFLPNFIKHSVSDAEIILIDNFSHDNSIKFVESQYPEITIIKLDKNHGFAGGYNQGLKKLSHKYFLIVNSDIEVSKNWIKPLIDLLKSDSNISVVQPKILNFNKKDEFEYAGAAGGHIDLLAYPICKGRIFNNIEKDMGQYENNTEIFWASGACMAIRADDFISTGGFDKDFFAHMEEIDLCWRLKNKGKKVLYTNKSIVYHVGGGTLNYGSAKKTFLNYRNNLWMIHKNYDGNIPLWLILISRIVLDQISGIRFLLTGQLKHIFQIYRAHFSYVSSLNKTQNKRKKIKKLPTYQMIGLIKQIVIWQYFIKQKRIFTDIIKSP